MLDIAILVVMATVIILQTYLRRQDEAAVRAAHVAELARRDLKIEQLLDQIQLNTQHLPYYPTVGPVEPFNPPELVAEDPFGYMAVTEDELTAAFAEIDRLGD